MQWTYALPLVSYSLVIGTISIRIMQTASLLVLIGIVRREREALASGASGVGTFSNCRSIKGGNGTTYGSSAAWRYHSAVTDASTSSSV